MEALAELRRIRGQDIRHSWQADDEYVLLGVREKILVVSADRDLGGSLIYEYSYVDGDVKVLASINASFPEISLLSGGALLIFDGETSYIYKEGDLLSVPGRVLWLGEGSALASPVRNTYSSNDDNDLKLYKLDGSVFLEEAIISNPTKNSSPIALVSSGFSNECIIKKEETSSRYYVLNVSDFQSGFEESDTRNYLTTYTARLETSPYGLSGYSYGATRVYTTSTFLTSDKGITIQWKPGDEEFIPLSKSADQAPEISYLEQSNLIHIKYDSNSVFTYNRETKEVTSSKCMLNEVPMSSRYTLWENDAYQFIVQNCTYNSLGPGNTGISFLLRKNKSTGVTERMQKKYSNCIYHHFPYAFNRVETVNPAK